MPPSVTTLRFSHNKCSVERRLRRTVASARTNVCQHARKTMWPMSLSFLLSHMTSQTVMRVMTPGKFGPTFLEHRISGHPKRGITSWGRLWRSSEVRNAVSSGKSVDCGSEIGRRPPPKSCQQNCWIPRVLTVLVVRTRRAILPGDIKHDLPRAALGSSEEQASTF